MNEKRRRLLQLGLGLVPMISCSSSQEIDTPNPESLLPECTLDDDLLPYGIQFGDAQEDSVIVSIQTEEENLQLMLLHEHLGLWVFYRRVALPSPENGYIRIQLDALLRDSLYSVVVHTQDRCSFSASFRTAPRRSRIIRFGATSCLGGNRPWPSLSVAAQQKYDFFCFLGDSVYADGSDTKSEYWAHWKNTLSQKGFMDLTASTSVVATWDDHEVDNNWSWNDSGIDFRFDNALAMFRRALPQREGGGEHGIWRQLDWGETLSLFVLDTRSERAGDMYLSQEQFDWLCQGLSTSQARFKIIVNSVPITDYSDLMGETQAPDRWQGYPEQRQELLSYIVDEGIEGVLFISGDFHFGQICRVSPFGEVGDELWEVLCGPGGSFLNVLGGMIPSGDQFVVNLATWNYTEFVCDPDDGSIAISFIADDGSLLEEYVLNL